MMVAIPAGVAADSSALLPQRARASRQNVHRFYLGITLLLIAMVGVGFWPGYFGPLTSSGVTRPWIIHLHGAVFSGWMALLLLQVSLASVGRVHLHRRIGNLGVAYGALVFVLGAAVA
jgi:hypothetical protein